MRAGRWKIYVGLALRALSQAANPRISLTAAGVAFYALLSFVPGLAAVISLWGLTANRQDVIDQLQLFGRILPPRALAVVSAQAQQISAADPQTIGLTLAVSLALSMFSASAAIRAIMQALNIVLEEKERRGFFRFQATAILITLVIAVGAIAALAAIVLAPWVLARLGLGARIAVLTEIIRWPLLFAGAWAGIAILYRLAPSKKDSHWRWIAPAAGAAVVVWIIASLALSLYAQNFANYNQTYGSLGAVVGLMLWFWISALSLLIGAEFGAALEGARRVKPPGPGQRVDT